MAITWRNVNAPQNYSGNNLIAQGGQNVLQGLRNIGSQATQFGAAVEQDVQNQFLTDLQGLDRAGYDQAIQQGDLNQEALIQRYGGDLDVGKALGSVRGFDQTLLERRGLQDQKQNRQLQDLSNEFIRGIQNTAPQDRGTVASTRQDALNFLNNKGIEATPTQVQSIMEGVDAAQGFGTNLTKQGQVSLDKAYAQSSADIDNNVKTWEDSYRRDKDEFDLKYKQYESDSAKGGSDIVALLAKHDMADSSIWGQGGAILSRAIADSIAKGETTYGDWDNAITAGEETNDFFNDATDWPEALIYAKDNNKRYREAKTKISNSEKKIAEYRYNTPAIKEANRTKILQGLRESEGLINSNKSLKDLNGIRNTAAEAIFNSFVPKPSSDNSVSKPSSDSLDGTQAGNTGTATNEPRTAVYGSQLAQHAPVFTRVMQRVESDDTTTDFQTNYQYEEGIGQVLTSPEARQAVKDATGLDIDETWRPSEANTVGENTAINQALITYHNKEGSPSAIGKKKLSSSYGPMQITSTNKSSAIDKGVISADDPDNFDTNLRVARWLVAPEVAKVLETGNIRPLQKKLRSTWRGFTKAKVSDNEILDMVGDLVRMEQVSPLKYKGKPTSKTKPSDADKVVNDLVKLTTPDNVVTSGNPDAVSRLDSFLAGKVNKLDALLAQPSKGNARPNMDAEVDRTTQQVNRILNNLGL